MKHMLVAYKLHLMGIHYLLDVGIKYWEEIELGLDVNNNNVFNKINICIVKKKEIVWMNNFLICLYYCFVAMETKPKKEEEKPNKKEQK